MSHTTKVEIKLTDKETLKEALKNLNLEIVEGTIKLYSTTHQGIGVKLPGWKYPVVFDEEGNVYYDNYNGHWGDKSILDKYLNSIKKEYATTLSKKILKNMGGVITSVKQQGEKTIIEAELPDSLLNYI